MKLNDISFEGWRQNLFYILSLDLNFAPFLAEGASWAKTKAQALRGFIDDDDSIPEAIRLTTQQKVSFLELMLGYIANNCPIISRNTLARQSTSVESIWNTIRLHFAFQVTGAHFPNFASV